MGDVHYCRFNCWELCANYLILFLGLLSYQNFIEIMMETMQTMTHWGKLKTVLEGYVGFDTVQEQIRKKSLKRGFEFNLMVVGKLKLCLCKIYYDVLLQHPTWKENMYRELYKCNSCEFYAMYMKQLFLKIDQKVDHNLLNFFSYFFPFSGATGLGKSTMVNTLFKGRLSRMSSTGAAAAIPKTVEVKSVSHGMMTCPCNFLSLKRQNYLCTTHFKILTNSTKGFHPVTYFNPLYSYM